MALTTPIVYERGDTIYLVAPVAPAIPTQEQIEEYAFGKDIVAQSKATAPNPNIAWFGGHYVEADAPNLNGAMWTAGDLAIASVTPLFMPVTVMHDPRTAVGLIADATLKVPDRDQVPRSKIDTALALWKHRFPEVVEEAEHNYREGSLMQSMECLAPQYDCSVCGMRFHKLPGGVERENWCAHLKESDPSGGYDDVATGGRGNPNASRILRGVTFTGTGLIFGTRGATGADPIANLEVFAEEVAEFHQRVHRDTATTKTRRRTGFMEIDEREYERIKSEREAAVASAAEERTKREEAERKTEQAEAAKAKAEEEATAAKGKLTEAEEQANRATLKDTRLSAFGSAFTEKIDALPTVKTRLTEQAQTMQDEEWSARLKEIEEMVGVKSDAKKDGDETETETPEAGKTGGETFTAEEVARSKAGGGNGGGNGANKQSPSARRSLFSGLVHGPEKAKS